MVEIAGCSATAPCVRQALHHSKKRIQTPVPRGRSTKIISMIEWIRTSRFSTKNSLFAAFREKFTYTGSETSRETRPFSMCEIADLGNPLVARNLKRCVRKTFYLRILACLVIYESGWVSLEHLLLSWYPPRAVMNVNQLSQPTLSLSQP